MLQALVFPYIIQVSFNYFLALVVVPASGEWCPPLQCVAQLSKFHLLQSHSGTSLL